jgi:hypothetical protein
MDKKQERGATARYFHDALENFHGVLSAIVYRGIIGPAAARA